ncbi:MAG: signal peptidase II [Candidatus Peregrinibacteria bacterium]
MLLLSVATLIATLGSLTAKYFADHFLIHRIPIIGNFAGLQLVHNPGIAFGIAFPPIVQELLIGMALVIVAIMAAKTLRHSKNSTYPLPTTHYSLAFGLILGGGLANILDRIPDGFVTDFFQVGSFPVFNVADSCITVGVVLLLLMMVQKKE